MIRIEELTFGQRLSHAWNVLRKRDDPYNYRDYEIPEGVGYSRPQNRTRLTRGNDRSIVSSIYTRIAMDVASHPMHVIKVNENDQYLEIIEDPNSDYSSLDYALSKSANIDQTGTQLIQDIAMSMFDEGYVAVVPTVTDVDPKKSDSFKILELRTARIIEWYPKQVRVDIYNNLTGLHCEMIFDKSKVAIIENPFYSIMNEWNSTLQRLIRKLNLLDVIDEQSGSGKLDLILQLPYIIKTDARRREADKRRKQIEEQLQDSKYGIAYTDGTERITQLNRAVDNNLMSQVEYLSTTLYNQLGLTGNIFDGTADEATMLNYNNRTIAPVLSAIAEEFSRKFLTKTAITQKKKIMWLSAPFKLVPAEKLSEIADKFTRNEILTSNEFRGIIGYKPSDDPKADELRNSNLNQAKQDTTEKIIVDEE